MNQNIAKKLNHYHCCDNLFECLNSEFKAIKFNKQFHYYYIVLHGLYSDSDNLLADEKNLELNMSSIEYVKLHLLNPNQLNTEKKKFRIKQQ